MTFLILANSISAILAAFRGERGSRLVEILCLYHIYFIKLVNFLLLLEHFFKEHNFGFKMSQECLIGDSIGEDADFFKKGFSGSFFS